MKNLRILFLLGFILFFSGSVWAQDESTKRNERAQTDLNASIMNINQPDKGQFLNGIREVKPKTDLEGSHYYADDWRIGSIFFNNGAKLEDLKLKYDMYNFELDIYDKEEIKAAPTYIVDRFMLYNHLGENELFLNADKFARAGELKGYLKVLIEGKYSAYEYYHVKIVKGSYNPALNTGNRNDRIKKEVDHYLLVDDNLVELPGSRRKALKLFEDKKSEMKAFVKQEKLSFKKSEDIVRIIAYYNSL